MPYATPRTWTAGELVTAAMLNAEVRDQFASGVMHKLSELSGAVASFDHQSLPQTFRSLLIVTYGRGDTAATTVSLRMRLQNISTSSYYDQVNSAAATTVTANEQIAQTSARIGTISGSTAPANLAGVSMVLIPHYTQSNKHKPYVAVSTGLAGLATTNIIVAILGGVFDSASAIDRVTILPSAGNFAADSISTVYGLPQ